MLTIVANVVANDVNVIVVAVVVNIIANVVANVAVPSEAVLKVLCDWDSHFAQMI